MPPTNSEQRLSQIMTLWSVVEQAHGADAEAATAARQRLLERTAGPSNAIYSAGNSRSRSG